MGRTFTGNLKMTTLDEHMLLYVKSGLVSIHTHCRNSCIIKNYGHPHGWSITNSTKISQPHENVYVLLLSALTFLRVESPFAFVQF